MKNVYLTLVSDVTADYDSNVANKFKLKPDLRLPGEGWKVSIQSAILLKMALFKELHSSNVNLITLYGKSVKNGAPNTVVEASFKSSELPVLEKNLMATTAEDFFNCIMHKLCETGHSKLSGGFKFSKEWTRLTWDKNGAHPEMIISSASATNLLYVHKTFANKMGWTKEGSNGKLKLGRNMVPVYATYEKGQSSLRNMKTIELAFGTYAKLNSMTDWRFINLSQSFKDALNLHARPLTVTANVTANKETVTQSLGQVYYVPQGRERYLFTPPVEEFHDAQTTHWEEVEISMKELDDKLVNFQPDSQCLIRLHFKKD